jgi:kinetochore protein Mis13/DSN1
MTTIFARSPLQSLPMAANRPTTRRRSVKQAFDEDDAPAPKRPRTEVNGTSKRANGAAKKAAKAAYDEDDDGFQFSRRTSKRTAKAQAAPVAPEPIPEEPPAKSARSDEPLPAKSTARRKRDTSTAIDPESSDTQKRRRSTRLSGDKQQLEARPKAAEAPAPKRTKKSAPVQTERKKQVTPAPEAQPEQKTALMGVKTPTQNELTVAKKRDPNAQRIMLPFADTPVITRNKEMRKGSKEGHRRSSTGLRGRRASSLIDSGMSNGEFRQA